MGYMLEHEPKKEDTYKHHCLASKITLIEKYELSHSTNIDRTEDHEKDPNVNN
jgi:hypothetical protein